MVEEYYLDDLVKRKLFLADPWYQLVFRMLNSVDHRFRRAKILEVGCGLGGFCIRMAKEGANVIGLDVSSNALRKARKLARGSQIKSRVDFVVGDAHFLPFKNGFNEIVVCSETLEHVSNYEKVFGELVRVLSKAGYLCVTVPNILSTLFFEEVVLLMKGQPQYARKTANVEEEHIFHIFKVKRLYQREDLEIIRIQSTDFLHLPPTIRKISKIDYYLRVLSDRIESFLEARRSVLRLFGANIGVLAQKR